MALESLWILWKRHQHHVGYAIVGLLLFAAGWHVGRVMSPYYAASPIVFQEAPNASPNTNSGSTQALVALREEGQVAAATTAQPVGLPAGASAKAGESTSPTPPANPAGKPPTPSARKLFVGSKNSNLYHHKDCPSAKQIKAENQIWWDTEEAAKAAGYSPSKCTQDRN